MKYVDYYNSPFGKIMLVANEDSLIGLYFKEENIKSTQIPIFDKVKSWLDIYFSSKKPNFTPKIKLLGTPFQKEVWEILLKISYGQTTSYGEVAKEIAIKKGISKMSAQAVGRAIGSNPISIIVPCHRVIKSNGDVGNYVAGTKLKSKLLDLEK